MSKQKLSRTPKLDMDSCVKNFNDNRFDLVIYASLKAREISKKMKGKVDYYNSPMSALLEIQAKNYERKQF